MINLFQYKGAWEHNPLAHIFWNRLTMFLKTILKNVWKTLCHHNWLTVFHIFFNRSVLFYLFSSLLRQMKILLNYIMVGLINIKLVWIKMMVHRRDLKTLLINIFIGNSWNSCSPNRYKYKILLLGKISFFLVTNDIWNIYIKQIGNHLFFYLGSFIFPYFLSWL